MWIFHEWNGGDHAAFDSEQKLNEFVGFYEDWYVKEFGEPPKLSDDYSIDKAELNPNFWKWINQ